MPFAVPNTVLVTDATSPVGRAVACALAGAGWAVVAQHDGAAGAGAQAAALAATLGRCQAVAADLGDESGLSALFETSLGPVGAVVHTAMVAVAAGAGRAAWDAALGLAVRVPFVLAETLRARLPAGARGAVVTVCDAHAWTRAAAHPTYAVSQAAATAMVRGMAVALAPRLRFNAVGCGAESDADAVAATVRFILAAPAMTGQVVTVGGGRAPATAPSFP